ncbi:MAG: hypothetical protein PHD19_06535 [Dechloromonas sp.]|nr:hypothetical protein [Dechloromonas sp.]
MDITSNEALAKRQALISKLDEIQAQCDELSRLWDANSALMEEVFPEQMAA